MNKQALLLNAREYIVQALKEDISHEDESTASILKPGLKGTADLICKQDGIVCGLPVFEETFKILDPDSSCTFFVQEGEPVKNGQLIGIVEGDMSALLTAERVALNYLQRMSGIATYTSQVAGLLKDTNITLLDTRKTTPNNRLFEKYAVKIGGGHNHRYNLSDGIMLKDNHISAAGSIEKAVKMARDYAPFVRKIEVECESLEQVEEALKAKADIIMLDNMNHETAKKAMALIGDKAQTEISGNVSRENIGNIIDLNPDFVSSGAITYSAGILDLSLKNLHPLE